MLTLAIWLSLGVGTSWAVTFSGDKCWTVHVTQTEDGPVNQSFILRLHIKQLDTITYAVHGYVSIRNQDPAIFMGTAARIGAKIYLNLASTEVDDTGDRLAGILRADLNPTTLYGSFWVMQNDFDPKTHRFEPSNYAGGTLALRSCP
jgi:hypothetical protein